LTPPRAERTALSFSIVIPTYGRPNRLARCLQALSDLDYRADLYEVVVVDDGSDEPAASAIASVCAQAGVRLERQAHNGPATARNLGALVARGDYVAFLDDDCEPARDWLSLLASRFQEAPEGAIGGRTVNAFPSNLGSVASQLLADYLQGHHVERNHQPRFLASNNFAVAAELFRSLGGFDQSFPVAGSEDRDLCDRWAASGHPVLFEGRALVLHSHPLTFMRFLRKHFEYGRGAFHFRRARANRHADRVRVEPLRFYVELVLTPFRHNRSPQSAALGALLLLSQVANAAGFLVDALHQRRLTRFRR
jgi:glycosyltransferase involved in cell wall biosynthesis